MACSMGLKRCLDTKLILWCAKFMPSARLLGHNGTDALHDQDKIRQCAGSFYEIGGARSLLVWSRCCMGSLAASQNRRRLQFVF